jgi:hypothetical protein
MVENTAADGSRYFIYLADNWVHGGPAGLIDASYIWLPLKINANDMTLTWVIHFIFAPQSHLLYWPDHLPSHISSLIAHVR